MSLSRSSLNLMSPPSFFLSGYLMSSAQFGHRSPCVVAMRVIMYCLWLKSLVAEYKEWRLVYRAIPKSDFIHSAVLRPLNSFATLICFNLYVEVVTRLWLCLWPRIKISIVEPTKVLETSSTEKHTHSLDKNLPCSSLYKHSSISCSGGRTWRQPPPLKFMQI